MTNKMERNKINIEMQGIGHDFKVGNPKRVRMVRANEDPLKLLPRSRTRKMFRVENPLSDKVTR